MVVTIHFKDIFHEYVYNHSGKFWADRGKKIKYPEWAKIQFAEAGIEEFYGHLTRMTKQEQTYSKLAKNWRNLV